MYHPTAYVRGMFAEPMDGPAGPVGCAIYSHEFYETDASRGFKRGIHLQVTRENALLLQAMRLERPWGEAMHRGAARGIPPLHPGADHGRRICRSPRTASFSPAGPRPTGFPASRSSIGSPKPRGACSISALDRAEEMLRAAGAHRVVRVPMAPFTGWHLLGTARMGADPASSVTDARGRCHAVADLMVVDGSLFPTVGAVNPGSTIGALALKLADDLARDIAPGEIG